MENNPGSVRPLRVLLITDVFPPGSGGSGWSTYYLGKALQDRGHEVRVLRPVEATSFAQAQRRVVEYGGLAVEEVPVRESPRLTRRLGLDKALWERAAIRVLVSHTVKVAATWKADVLHGQHAISAVAVSQAASKARRSGLNVVSVVTVRDYWPLCPSSTRLFTERDGTIFECRECHRLGPYTGCLRKASGVRPQLAPGLLKWWRTLAASRALARCDRVVAVSDYVRQELVRSGRLKSDRVVTLPNLVDLSSVERALGGSWPLHDISPETSYLLFAGKLDPNKGAQLLADALEWSGVTMPVVFAGDGPLRARLEEEAGRRGLDFRFYDWLDNDSVLLLMRHARALLFPSAWQEPLSRVLLEGCAAGAAIVALDTGGTGDIITHGESGLLARNLAELSQAIKQVVEDDNLNTRLCEGARRRAEERFAAPVVSARVESLYYELLDGLRKW